MNTVLKNNKGVVLMSVYFVLIVLLILSATTFMRSLNEHRYSKINADSMQAFYEAEAGISYAYYELYNKSFQDWFTHSDKDTVNADFDWDDQDTLSIAAAYGDNGYYQVAGRDFRVKTYPDPDVDGVVVAHSQATINGITRSVEYRLGQQSAYEYFFFFPRTTRFGNDTYDGRNFGRLHVNGDIELISNPRFYFLTALTCGSETVGEGYIKRAIDSQFYNCWGEQGYDTTFSYPWDLPSSMFYNNTIHFSTGTTYFASGEYKPVSQITSADRDELPYYLDGAWNWDKYKGDYDVNDNLPYKYEIGIEDLNNLALYEMQGSTLWGNQGTTPMFAENTVTISNRTIGSGTEKAIFQAMIDNPGEAEGHWNEFWEQWKTNHTSDYAAYSASFTGGQDWERRFYLAAYDNKWSASADWNQTGPDKPYRVNMEWWQDLSYGDDRAGLTDDLSPAKVIFNELDSYTGEESDKYFLNTQFQGGTGSSWETWLSENGLHPGGDSDNIVQDKSMGGEYVTTPPIFGRLADYDHLKQEAVDSGIFIGWDNAHPLADVNLDGIVNLTDMAKVKFKAGSTDLRYDVNKDGIVNLTDMALTKHKSGEIVDFKNPIAECTQAVQFYNVRNPAGYYSTSDNYKPSNVLVIDVHKLKEKIEEDKESGGPLANFNGILYIDLASCRWAEPSYVGTTSLSEDWTYDINAESIMLVNAETLPEGGLSIITPHNVLIKGNYNLDPDGNEEKNREKDDDPLITNDGNVIERVISNPHTHRTDGTSYSLTQNDLQWQPAEVITQRGVYTLSEDFTEPTYMPMYWTHDGQYYEERDRISQDIDEQNFVSGDAHYPENSWVPTPDSTKTATSSGGALLYPDIDTWFTYYRDTHGNPVAVPADWNEWLLNPGGTQINWPDNTVYALDTDGDNIKDRYISSNKLKQAVREHIESVYDTTYSHNAVHGYYDSSGEWVSGSGSADTPAQNYRVNEKHIYNTAIVTPYDPEPFVLEYWEGSGDRVVNGAFIQLSDKKEDDYIKPIPLGAQNRTGLPDNFFNYETRFGKNAAIDDRPKAGITFASDNSWREIKNEDF
ncbi:MAG: dockerin type I repeat-containing protein [Candidatus Omnitrophica bacterium]|nr:dockerin type I repeat-containing protein [Candidatus Omnitrophota bacterium]